MGIGQRNRPSSACARRLCWSRCLTSGATEGSTTRTTPRCAGWMRWPRGCAARPRTARACARFSRSPRARPGRRGSRGGAARRRGRRSASSSTWPPSQGQGVHQRPRARCPSVPESPRAHRSGRRRRAQATRCRLRMDRCSTAGAGCCPPGEPEDQSPREAADPRRLYPADPGFFTGVKRTSLLWREADTSTLC